MCLKYNEINYYWVMVIKHQYYNINYHTCRKKNRLLVIMECYFNVKLYTVVYYYYI